MNQKSQPEIRAGRAVALLAIAGATLLRAWLAPLLGSASPYLIYQLAVTVAGWYGGLVPGLLATVAGAVAGKLLFVSPALRLGFDHPAELASFLVALGNGIAISLLCEGLHRARRRAGAAADAARRSAALVASSNDPIIGKDLAGRVVSWNAAAERAYGFGAAEMLGGPGDVIVPDERRGELQALFERAARGERVDNFETLRRGRDGRLLDVSLSLSPVKDEDGRVVGVADIDRDLSERRRMEEAVRESEGRWRALVENAPDQILRIGEHGRILFVNRGGGGYEAEELVGRCVAELIPSRHRAEVEEALRAVFERRLAISREVPIVDRKGRLHWYESRIGPLLHDGTVIEAVMVAKEITERKHAERDRERLLAEAQAARVEAEQARHRSEFLARATAALAGSLDHEEALQAVVRLAAPEFADWCVADVVEADGEPRRLAVAHADPARRGLAERLQHAGSLGPGGPRAVARVLQTGHVEWARQVPDDVAQAPGLEPDELGLLRALGLRSYILMPLVTRGQTLGVLTFVRGAGRPPFSENDLRTADELWRCAAVAVDHARLYREAQEANRLKDEFLATLSHELRTPLNAIVGWTHLLQTGELDAETARRAVQTIERNARLQTQLTSDILDVSRIVSGKLHLEARAVELPPLIQSVLDSALPAARAKGIELVSSQEGEARPVSGDPNRLQQVVWNLVWNAIKFTPPGGRVEVALRRAGEQVQIRVADTGVGISHDFLPHVFERFRQADASSTRGHGGLGLGLAIVKHLVELHGGTVEAASDGPDRGAVFDVRLPPAGAAALAGEGERRRAAGNPPREPPSLEGVRVLVVDDEPIPLESMSAALQERGARVWAAASAGEALDAVSRFAPHVVVSDLEMPGENGYALIRRIRALPPDRGGLTPAAAVTAYVRMEDRLRTLVSGFQLHLAKPVDPSELVAVVASLAGRLAEPAAETQGGG